MTRFKTSALAILSALTMAGTLTTTSVQAKPFMPFFPHPHYGWGPGFVGGLALGGLIAAGAAASEDDTEVQCRIVERVNVYGDVVTRRICTPVYE